MAANDSVDSVGGIGGIGGTGGGGGGDAAGTPVNAAADEPVVFADAAAWRAWLEANEHTSDGVWLMLAKKGTTQPTSLMYQEALEIALCSGWIDGQRKSFDAGTFRQRYTPRRARSIWSQRNVEIIARLEADGLLRDRGLSEVNRAKADGRWDRAYAGPAGAEVPAELAEAFAAAPEALAAFEGLNRTARYSALHPIISAVKPETRAKRAAQLVARLTHRPIPGGDKNSA